MPRRCCVPGCKSNYDSVNELVSTFSFPKDGQRKEAWIRAIHRDDFLPSASSVVCVVHFAKKHVIEEDVITRDDGTILRVK